jgi:hypothetical protein
VPAIDLKRLKAHRVRTFATSSARRLSSPAQALAFVNARGFVYFWPIKGVDLPSLWTAVAGDRPVADEHDDPGHVTWSWKDDALDKKVWYYAKILRRKATLISLEIVPYFYALSENYGSPEEDYLLAYEEGRLTQAAKQVYEALLKEGALNTIDLRRAAKLGNARESEFNRALEYLQTDFKILPVGVAEAGAWRYSFIYEVVPRYYPDLPKKARRIGEASGRRKLAELYFQSVGVAQFRDLVRLFGWGSELTTRTISQLKHREVIKAATFPKKQGEWLALSEMCS